MNNIPDIIVDSTGIALGLYFMYLYMREARSLVGSAFKTYHRWMTVGAGLFMFAFVSDYASIIMFGSTWLDIVHNVLLVAAVIVFTATNLSLPHEANKYLNLHKDGPHSK